MASSAITNDLASSKSDPATVDKTTQPCFADVAAVVILFVAMSWTLMLRLNDGVVPHDSGTLAHAAERVLQGEWPHRDFDDPYTGLLSFLNAAAMHSFGINLVSLRFILFPVTLVGFLLLYGMLRFALPPATAALVTATAFAWSVPNYFSAMPSWYNLYCTLFGIAALWQYARTGRLGWAAAAGALTGVSFLFKSVGLYFTAIAALFVIFREQRRSESQPPSKTVSSPQAAGFLIAGLSLYILGIVWIVASYPHVPEMVTFLVPAVVPAAYLIWNERRLRFCGAGERLRSVLVAGGAFAGAALAPILFFITPYVVTGSFGAWWNGVFVTPFRRLADERLTTLIAEAPFSAGLLMLIAVCCVLAVAARSAKAYVGCGILGLAGLAVMWFGGTPSVYAASWQAVRLAPLACATILCFRLARRRPNVRRSDAETLGPSDLAFLFVAAAGVFGLIQFPIAHGIYLLYVAPLVIASSAVLLALLFPRTQVPVVVCGLITLGFSATWIWSGHPFFFGASYSPVNRTTAVASDRSRVKYDAEAAKHFSALAEEVTKRTPPGAPILAIPDSPDIYFLTGRTNPTRTFFDVFDADFGTPERDRRLLELLDREGVKLVVLRNLGAVSPGGVSTALRDEIRKRFPNVVYIQEGNIRYFSVRWRDEVPGMTARSGAMPVQLLASDDE